MDSAVVSQLYPKMTTGALLMVISEKRFLTRCCISISIRHDLVVAVISLLKATQLVDRGHTGKQKKSLHSGTVAHMKNIT